MKKKSNLRLCPFTKLSCSELCILWEDKECLFKVAIRKLGLLEVLLAVLKDVRKKMK
jgi:hypothetical protein